MSDTQHEEAVHVTDVEAARDRERREARELAYQDVSLRAVELLASAQRAADEAVAEAQSYARDLEETAREQYRHILQRAQDAAHTATGTVAADGEVAAEGDAVVAGAASADAGGGLDSGELQYVRTYARVAHTQLKAVFGALNDELDRLAELADGSAPSAADVRASSPGESAPDQDERHDGPQDSDTVAYHDGHEQLG